ncbi:MAG: hypothetical protein J5806_04105 [Lentisphaeria bacterium]|nr:hypothetical protein [Lentisphaeria bacterium]
MSTGFTPLTEIADGIVQRIRTGAGDQFKLITYAQATNGAQIWEMLQTMSSVPGCVAAVGSGEYGPDALKRTVRVMIFVVDGFSRGTANAADGIWRRMETVLNLFLPDRQSTDFARPKVCGIEFAPVSWSPVESDENICAFSLVLEGTEFLLEESE